MSYPERRPSVAASEPVGPSDGPGTGEAAVEALARILDAEDPATVNWVARLMRAADAREFDSPSGWLVPWGQLQAHHKRWYRAKARAALRALRAAADYRLVSEEPS
jgi:hypothetical protein